MDKNRKTISRLGKRKIADLGPVTLWTDINPGQEENKIVNTLVSDLLFDFLNVNSDDIDEIDSFCKIHKYLPKDISNGWQNGFRQEQNEVAEFIKKHKNDLIKLPEMQLLASKLTGVTKEAKLFSNKQLLSINKKLYLLHKNRETYDKPHLNETWHIIFVPCFNNIQSEIWYQISELLKTKRPIRQCEDYFRCRRFYSPIKSNQRFCTEACRKRSGERESNK